MGAHQIYRDALDPTINHVLGTIPGHDRCRHDRGVTTPNNEVTPLSRALVTAVIVLSDFTQSCILYN